MPKRKTKTKRKKRNYNRATGTTIVSMKGSNPLPKMFKALLRYNDIVQISGGVTGTTGSHLFRVNSVYDPDFTGVGHQPSGFDQIMPMYDHYVVIASKIICTFANTDASNAVYVGIDCRDSDSKETDPKAIIEAGTNKFAVLGPAGSTRDVISMSYQVNPNKFLGRSKPLSDPNLKGTDSANPTEQCWWHVWTASVPVADPGNVDVSVLIDYTVMFIEPKPVGLS